MTNFKKVCMVTVLLSAFGLVTSAGAIPIRWDLGDLDLASGFFEYDAQTNVISDYYITGAGGGPLFIFGQQGHESIVTKEDETFFFRNITINGTARIDKYISLDFASVLPELLGTGGTYRAFLTEDTKAGEVSYTEQCRTERDGSITCGWVYDGEQSQQAQTQGGGGGNHYGYADGSNVAIPEPTTLFLLSSGLIGLGFNRRRK